MADDTTLGAAVGVGDKISTDDLGAGTKVQRVKVQFGADGSATDASTASPLPVVQTGALPAGANAIGVVDTELTTADLDSGAGTDTRAVVGLVIAKSGGAANISGSDPLPVVQSGTALVQIQGGGVIKAEDVAASSGDSGFPALGVRNDTAATLTSTDGDYGHVALDSAGRVGVSDLGGSVTVDNAGTFAVQIAANSAVNVAQVAGTTTDTNSGVKSAGTQRVVLATDQPQLTNALKVDGSAVTQPVSGPLTDTQLRASAVPVSGTVTASGPLTDTQLRASAVPVSLASAPSTAVTNAGTFAVQDSEKVADNAGFTDGTTKVLPAGYIFDEVAGTALTENDAGAARMDSKRAQVFALEDATTRGQRAAISAAGRLSVDASGVAVPITDNSGSLTVDAPVGTPAFVRLSDGAAAITTLATSLASLPALATGSNLVGRVNLEPETTGGLSIFHLVSAATTNATNVKASAGQVYGWYVYNSNAAARKLVFHNTAGTPTAGASVIFAIVIPPTSAANVEFTTGIAFATGIAITTVTDLTDAGTTAVAASDLIINVFYK